MYKYIFVRNEYGLMQNNTGYMTTIDKSNLPGRSGCSNPSEAGHLPPIVRAQLKELKETFS